MGEGPKGLATPDVDRTKRSNAGRRTRAARVAEPRVMIGLPTPVRTGSGSAGLSQPVHTSGTGTPVLCANA